MKNLKKLASLLLALVMVFSLAITVSAQTVGTASAGTGSITISNPSMGETYKIVKLFDASVTGTEGGSIAYTGDIPTDLTTVFEKDGAGNIKVKNGTTEKQVTDAVTTWATSQAANAQGTVSNGEALTFAGLAYGYYAVVSSQGAVVTIDSTNPTVTVTDKNSTDPTPPTKDVNDPNVKIGDPVTYTVKFKTANYNGAKKIVSYTIHDDQPTFLSNVTVTSITVDGTAIATQQFNSDKKIVIPWIDASNNHLYKNGAEVVITYTATVTDVAAVDGDGNTNTVTLTWNDEDGTVPPDPDNPNKYKDSATIYTYALALKKVDPAGAALAGATFQFPFYVKETADTTDGAYIYAGTTAGTGLTNTITTPADGVIIVKGLESDTEIAINETVAPAGYNKLTEAVKVTPVKTSSTTTSKSWWVAADGTVYDEETTSATKVTLATNKIAATPVLVVNKTGAELPSTGGMGTTLFYVFGGILVAAAVVLLVTKKRMNAAE